MSRKTTKTVGDLIAELRQLPQNLPVYVGTHYDNDTGLTDTFDVSVARIEHSESIFYYETDDPNATQGVAIY